MTKNALHWCLRISALFLLISIVWAIHSHWQIYRLAKEQLQQETQMPADAAATDKHEKSKKDQQTSFTQLQNTVNSLAQRQTTLREVLEQQQSIARHSIWWLLLIGTVGFFFSIKAFHFLEDLYVQPMTSLAHVLGNALRDPQKSIRVQPCQLAMLNLLSVRCNQLLDACDTLRDAKAEESSFYRRTIQQLLDSTSQPMVLLKLNGEVFQENSLARKLPHWKSQEFQEALGEAFRKNIAQFQAKGTVYTLVFSAENATGTSPCIACVIRTVQNTSKI